MKRRLSTVGIVVLLSVVFTGVAYAQGGEPAATAVATVLAPLAAAALGIERILEIAWGFVESIFVLVKKDKFNSEEKEYKAFKTWVSAALGLVIGYQVAIAARLMMFTSVGIQNVDAHADMLITGLVIGSGSKFTHDIIGIFSEGKGLIEEYKKYTERRENGNNESS